MAHRTFTFRQAQELLPVLEGLLRGALKNKKRSEEIDARFQEINTQIMLSGGMLIDIEKLGRLRKERNHLTEQIKDKLAEIAALGVQVKDLDIGLLDFPCVVEGETILLCWKLGEKSIGHWHGVKEGFAGRKRIDSRIVNAGPRGRGRSLH